VVLTQSEFPPHEIHVEHNGVVWLVTSHIDAQHQFEHLAEALRYANCLRDSRPGERYYLILHRACDS
jgi:hypothetical protein